MIELSDSTFTNETSQGVVIIDFWADFCSPCKMFSSVFEKLSKKYTKIKFCKVDTSEYGQLAVLNGVNSLPTVIIMKDGKQLNKLVGLQSEKKLSEILDNLNN